MKEGGEIKSPGRVAKLSVVVGEEIEEMVGGG